MTSSYQKDAFFDSDEDQGPNLTGEYNRGNTPPTYNLKQSLTSKSAGSSTSGHYSSDSIMSKSKETLSRDALDTRSRSRSPSAQTRTPSGSSYRYSDSFDSEASGDSRRGSPSRSRRGGGGGGRGKKKSGGITPRRFDSGTSRDSRSSFVSYNSSVYGKSNKKGPQQKRGRGRGRASSNPSSMQNTPRTNNANEVSRRMLSAKGHTINRLRNEYEVLKSKHEELQREFKLQKEIHRKNARELDKYTRQEEQLPNLMKAQNAEVEHFRKKCQGYRDREREKDQRLKQYNEKINKLEDELKRARSILENNGLKERADLEKERDGLEEKMHEKEQKLEELEKYVSNMKKNQRHERRDWKSHEREYKGQIERLHTDNENLRLQLREKEKELDIKNIYSNRIVKLPGRLRTTSHSPTSLQPIMYHKSTTTDEIKLNSSPRHPHPPESKRANSADERLTLEPSNISRTKSPKDERYRRKAEEQRKNTKESEKENEPVTEEEKKELSEHERILMELDSGIKKPEETKRGERRPPEEEEESERILRQFDDDSKIKGNSQRQQAEEDRWREEERKRQEEMREEEERRRMEEEERKQKQEDKKPQWLKGTTSSSSSSGYSPSAFGNAAPRQAGSQSQHKAATSKLPWLASDSPVHKPEQERREQQKEQDAKLTNGFAESPRRTPTLKTSEDEEDYPFFGSKPTEAKPASKTSNQPFAVNSVKDLQKYSAFREPGSPSSNPDYNGLFASPGHSALKDDAKNEREKQEQEAKEEEERHKKDLLLARMREIDDGKKPDSGRSRKVYNHTDPVKNMHNGLPSHPEQSQKERRKSLEDDLTFGSYAPSFASNSSKKTAVKETPKKKNPFFDNDSDGGFTASPKQSPQRAAKKNDLMADLFGSGSEKSDNPSRGSFGEDDVFSTSTKAKPVAGTGAYPWEKKVNVGQGHVNKPTDNGMPGAAQKTAAPVTSYSDEFDDIEEMTL